ncbi:MAG: DUF1116 domain-containing protein, partial [Thermoproteota archaeon]
AYLVDIQPAIKVIPGFKYDLITHAGPPIEWDRMAKVQKVAIINAALAEGLADSPEKAEKLIERNEILIAPNHDYNLVSGMCGATAASFPVLVIKDPIHENTAFVWQQTDITAFGDKFEKGISEINFVKEVLAPVIRGTIKEMGNKINIKEIMALGLQMGDELHSRFDATLGIFLLKISSAMLSTGFSKEELKKVVEYFVTSHGGKWYPGNLTMGACKVMTMSAENIKMSTIVTVMSRNGVEFGIRVSGLGKRWFTGPAGRVTGFTFPGYTHDDAAPDIGDSAIIETRGLGCMTIAASPSQSRFLGGLQEAIKHVKDMYRITVGRDPMFRILTMDFSEAPVGIDIRKVLELNIVPKITTGMAHKEGGHSIIGAGVAEAPIEAFKKAIIAFAREYL